MFTDAFFFIIAKIGKQAKCPLNGKRKCDMLIIYKGFPDDSVGKESAYNAGDTRDSGAIPRLRRFPGEGNGNPLQYSCLENPMDREASWARVTRSQRVAHD